MALTYVKPHGALYGAGARDETIARAVADAAAVFGVPVMGMAGKAHETAAKAAGVGFIAEYYADLEYDDDGFLIITRKHIAYDPEVVVRRARRVIEEGVAETASGGEIPMRAETVCVHSDTPGAPELVQGPRGRARGHPVPILRSTWPEHEVQTPIPGVFYRRPSPDEDEFVQEGDDGRVRRDDRPGGDHEELPGGRDRGGRQAGRVPRRQRGRGHRRAGGRRRRRRRMTRVLVANRGEIALRVIRAAHDLGLEAVAVHSTADAGAPHVREADAAVEIGPAPAGKSYLSIPALIEAAKESGADIVHPGYGFLSERAEFAKAVEDAGLAFAGPTSEHIALMGDKARAREAADDAGVPTIPGSDGAVEDVDERRRRWRRRPATRSP